MKKEIWLEVLNYEGMYQVSNFGRIKSLKRNIIRKLSFDTGGYLCLCLSKEGTNKTFLVHILVARAFLGNPLGKEVNHKDGIKTNNNLDNLEYVTRSENMKHAFRLGLHCTRGERSTCAILKNEDIPNIRRISKEGMSQREIARMFNVSRGAIVGILSKKTWIHI